MVKKVIRKKKVSKSRIKSNRQTVGEYIDKQLAIIKVGRSLEAAAAYGSLGQDLTEAVDDYIFSDISANKLKEKVSKSVSEYKQEMNRFKKEHLYEVKSVVDSLVKKIISHKRDDLKKKLQKPVYISTH